MLKAGDIVEKYKIVRKIGRGGFGNVYVAESLLPPCKQYALKIMEDVTINDEVKIGMTLGAKCSSLVGFKEVFAREEGLIIVMEYCSGGDLAKRIERSQSVSDLDICRFVYESSLALKTLHDAGIIHRDIKPSNFFILITGGYKLGDYGLAQALEIASTRTQTRVGSDGYVSPEILDGKKYSKKSDIFALGVTFMEYMLGHNPFRIPGHPVSLSMVMKGMTVEAARTHPHPIMELARRMIAVNPDERPSIEEVLSFPIPIAVLTAGLREERDAAQREKEMISSEKDELRAQLVAERRCNHVLQSFAFSKPIATFGYQIEKFVPIGKIWKKVSPTDWVLEQDNYTYEITASSVYGDNDNHAPHNLFSGRKVENRGPDWGVWASTNCGNGEVVLRTKRAELFHYIYMQARGLYSGNQSPVDFAVLGSNDGVNYDELAHFEKVQWTDDEEKPPFPLMTRKAYLFYKLRALRSERGEYVALAQLNFGVLKKSGGGVV